MASLPQRPASQRRPSPRDDSASFAQDAPSRSDTFSTTSEDSQTVLLNSPPRQQARPVRHEGSKTEDVDVGASSAAAHEEQPEPRKCWICFNDETEDDETTSEWRSPCPCVLVAHEKCLLDWIADMEAPSSRRTAGARAGKILCPQCKSEIHLQRPRSLVVDMVRVVERLTGMFLLPGVITFAGTAAYTTLALIGQSHVYTIFGTEDGLRILAPLYQTPNIEESNALVRVFHGLRDHWRLHLGLPLIPTVLMASRTTLLDSFLPFLPLIFFVSSGKPQDELLQFSWPPSAAFTVATLPYIRGIYNTYYDRVWLPREQQWLKEIQPRAGSNDAEAAQGGLEIQVGQNELHDHVNDEDLNDEGEEDVIEDALEVEVDFDIFADWNNGGAADNNNAPENPPVPIARGPAHPLNAPPLDHEEGQRPHPVAANDNAAPAPNVPMQPAAAPQHRPRRVRRERNIAFSSTSLADTILGALIFPSVAAAVGEALKHTLPKAWVTSPSNGKPTGFLQTRWGRSLLGGCLFVGMKDAVMLYVRWRMAVNHRKRSILNYDKPKGSARQKSARA